MKDQIVTRFDTRETEDGTEIRLFNKRTKLFAFGVDDAREDFEEALPPFLAAKPRSLDQVEDFLTQEPGDEDEDEEQEGGGSVVPERYRIKYGATQRCGDDVAEELSGYVTLPRAKGNGKVDIDGGLDRDRLRKVAADNSTNDGPTSIVGKLANYEDRGLNGGLLRMNVSNILRGMVRRGERVIIGDRVWEAREVEKPKRARKAKAAPAAK